MRVIFFFSPAVQGMTPKMLAYFFLHIAVHFFPRCIPTTKWTAICIRHALQWVCSGEKKNATWYDMTVTKKKHKEEAQSNRSPWWHSPLNADAVDTLRRWSGHRGATTHWNKELAQQSYIILLSSDRISIWFLICNFHRTIVNDRIPVLLYRIYFL